MSAQTLRPLSITVQTGCSGAVSALTNDPDSGNDGNWVAATSHTTDVTLEVNFADAAGTLTTGAGLQEIRARVRGSNGSNSPDGWYLDIYEGGTLRQTIYSASNPSGNEAIISGTWDASILSTQAANADVRVRFRCTADPSPPGQVASADVDSIEWNVTYTAGDQTVPVSDAGAGADGTPSIAATIPLADTGAGAGTLAIAASAPLADAGAGADGTPSIAATIPLADAGAGADAVDVDTGDAATYTIFGVDEYGTEESDSSALEIGITFYSSVAGQVTGIRFYKHTNNTGTHVGNLWTAGGSNLATKTFSGETGTGWQEQLFDTPVSIDADTIYVASYHTTTGFYSASSGYFDSADKDSTPLIAPQDNTDPLGSGTVRNGVYNYSETSVFPDQTYNASNYWVDLVFETGAGGTTKSPTDTGTGTDATPAIAVSAPLASTGAGADAVSVAVSLALADAGAGADALAAYTLTLITDTGAAADGVGPLAASVPVADSGTGTAGSPGIATLVGVAEAGTGADTLAMLVHALLTDQGAGADAVNVVTATLVQVAETALGTDAAGPITVTATIADTGAGADAAAVQVTLQVAESATGSEAPLVNVVLAVPDAGAGTAALSQSASVIVADTGAGNDATLAITVTLAITDTGAGLDSVYVEASAILKGVADTGAGLDSVYVDTAEALKALADAGAGVSNVDITATVNTSDAGTAVESLVVTVRCTVADDAEAAEAVLVAAQVAAQDIAAGSDAVVQVAAQVAASDSGTGAEQLAVQGAIMVLEAGVGSDVAMAYDADKRIASLRAIFGVRSIGRVLSQRYANSVFTQRQLVATREVVH